MLKLLFSILFLATQITSPEVVVKDYRIGASSIKIQTTNYAPLHKGVYFINLHANETTSIEATNNYLVQNGGCFLQLQHGEVRYVSFVLNNTNYKIDPNRIFTPIGRKETLKKNSIYNMLAEKETANFADTILAQLKHAKLIIAMHNNTNNDLSIKSYTKGKSEAINAAAVYINDKMDADDFIYTTEQSIFQLLKKQQINVVLQKTQGFKDDGSLSIYCGKKNIPYINIEAEEGHKEQQLQMLQAITTVVDWYNK